MTDRPRAEHLAWCQQRALEYADRGDLANAVASMISDMGKHPETEPAIRTMAPLGLFTVQEGPRAVRDWIEGFN